MEKLVCCFGMQIGRYGRAAPTVKIEDPMVKIQAYPNKKQSKIVLGGRWKVCKHIIIEFDGIVVK